MKREVSRTTWNVIGEDMEMAVNQVQLKQRDMSNYIYDSYLLGRGNILDKILDNFSLWRKDLFSPMKAWLQQD
jgi:phosphodiesterase/alkaline phosphatase D-like protein